MIREIINESPFFSFIIALFLLILSVFLIDLIFCKTETYKGHVIDKHYKPEQNSTSTGYGMTSNGQNGVVVTQVHESEKFLLIVKSNGGRIFTVEAHSTLYYQKETGDPVRFDVCVGRLTGVYYGSSVIK